MPSIIIFLSAFLLFQVQLILGKFILPMLGGSPSVWTTCMLFFQLVLLAGYAYVNTVDRVASPRRQASMQIILLGLATMLLGMACWRWGTAVLPPATVLPAAAWPPALQVLLLLLVGIGLPYFVLSTTSPIIQRWVAMDSTYEHPYRLYALSNAGSLLALISYPFLVEPYIGLHRQTQLWTGGFVLYGLVTAFYASRLRSTERKVAAPTNVSQPPRSQQVLWLCLAFCPSALFLSVTNELTQDVAVVPLLWVLPLALYLLSFIISFDSPRWYHRRWYLLVGIIVTFIGLSASVLSLNMDLARLIIAHSICLFVLCMLCHGELARLQPPRETLTRFYLIIATGGACGGVFVALIAPLMFTSFWELHLSILACWIVIIHVLWRDRESCLHVGDIAHFALIAFVVLCLLTSYGIPMLSGTHWRVLMTEPPKVFFATPVLLTVLALLMGRHRTFPHSALASRIFMVLFLLSVSCSVVSEIKNTRSNMELITRNFYGVVHVKELVSEAPDSEPYISLAHGRITHGIQFIADSYRLEPTSYFSRDSGIGVAHRIHPRRRAELPLRVGVTGLGVGGIAAYAKEGDVYRFYEINPAVIAYSSGEDPLFTYLQKCLGQIDVVTGDARLSLEREQENGSPQNYDILVLDVFTGDAIPTHLLTAEIFTVYQHHLRSADSIIAAHISNRFLNLEPVIYAHAEANGLHAVTIKGDGTEPKAIRSTWVLLTRNETLLQSDEIPESARTIETDSRILWTDDYSNLFCLLKRK